MKKSLFRPLDIIELAFMHLACFTGNSLFDYVETLGPESFIWLLFEGLRDYRGFIVAASTIIVIVCYYQILTRKHTEIYCRILIGDALSHLVGRYILHSFSILGVTYLISIAIDSYCNFGLITNFYLFCLMLMYVPLSSIMLTQSKLKE